MVRVAIDVGPLHGPRTGIGNAVDWMISALEHHRDVELLRYLTSARSTPNPGERRLPLPAAVALRWWARSSIPMDRLLGRPDVVHGTNYVVPPTRVPRLISVYDCWFLDHPQDAHPDVALAGRVLRRAVHDGAHVITSSDATRERVLDLLDPRSAETVLLGPPPRDLEGRRDAVPGVDPAVPFVLSLGTVERRKNLPTLVTAFARVASEHPTVELQIAGRDGDDSTALEQAVAALPPAIGTRVNRHRNVPDSAKRWLLDHASVLAYPSLDEGFGFPVLEAQMAGVPVVASSAGSIPEVAGRGALLSTPSDPDALAANLYWALTSDSKRTDLVARGHENVERFSWERTATELTDHYRRLAEGDRR